MVNQRLLVSVKYFFMFGNTRPHVMSLTAKPAGRSHRCPIDTYKRTDLSDDRY